MLNALELIIQHVVENTWALYLDAAPFVMIGLLSAGLIKAWVPQQRLASWLGGDGLWPITKAAVIGAPLPLCSCAVIPVTLGLHRAGASRGSTLSFLIATPETGVDSITTSFALLGPFMTVIRPVTAILSGIVTGLLGSLVSPGRHTATPPLVQPHPVQTPARHKLRGRRAYPQARAVLRHAVMKPAWLMLHKDATAGRTPAQAYAMPSRICSMTSASGCSWA